MRCNRLALPALFFLLSIFIVIGFLQGLSTALQVAFLDLIAMSVLQLGTSGYKNGPKREGYIIGAFTFLILNLGALGDTVWGLILVPVLTGLMLCVYEITWFGLWKGNGDGNVQKLLWSLSIVGILYLVYLKGIKSLLSVVFLTGIILEDMLCIKNCLEINYMGC